MSNKQQLGRFVEAFAELNKKFERLHEIKATAEREGRDLSRREAAELARMEQEALALRARVEETRPGGRFDPRQTQGTPLIAEESRGAMLAPDQRISDQLHERRGSAGDYEDRLSDLSFGKIVRAAVTGERRTLNDAERRAMAEGVDASGGYLVAEELSSNIIDLARANAVVFQAGAMTAIMETDTLNLARLATGSTASWKLENDPVTSSDMVWERVQLVSKTVVVQQLLSRELYEDLTPEADGTIRGEIAAAIGLKIDLAVLEGSGTPPEPRGILNTTGVNTVDMGGNGGTPNGFNEIVKADFASRKNNGLPATAAVMHPRDGESYALEKASDGQPLRRPEAIADLPFLTTSQIRIDRTKGTSSDTSTIYVGDFSRIVVGFRPSLQIRFQVLQERHSSNLQVGFLAWARMDCALMHPAHLTKIVGLRPF
jgi:HK97 family phage major capsid protein